MPYLFATASRRNVLCAPFPYLNFSSAMLSSPLLDTKHWARCKVRLKRLARDLLVLPGSGPRGLAPIGEERSWMFWSSDTVRFSLKNYFRSSLDHRCMHLFRIGCSLFITCPQSEVTVCIMLEVVHQSTYRDGRNHVRARCLGQCERFWGCLALACKVFFYHIMRYSTALGWPIVKSRYDRSVHEN